MSDEFITIIGLRNSIQAATHEIKRLMVILHERSGVPCGERDVSSMGISNLVLYINELEAIVKLTGSEFTPKKEKSQT